MNRGEITRREITGGNLQGEITGGVHLLWPGLPLKVYTYDNDVKKASERLTNLFASYGENTRNF